MTTDLPGPCATAINTRLVLTFAALGALAALTATPAVAQVSVKAKECPKEEPTCDPEWSLKHTGTDRAKEKIRGTGKEPGEGIVVGVLDTGYAISRGSDEREHMHPELGDALIEERGYAFECDRLYDGHQVTIPEDCPYWKEPGESGDTPEHGERQARDRMDTTFIPYGRQPGHGTGPMSVLISPDGAQTTPTPNEDARVVGVAPGAKVVPIRATQGVVLMEKRAWDMARGIARLVLHDPEGREPEYPPVDVISMSVGRRAPHAHLEKAVLLAERRGIIVVAAAGQGSLESFNGGPVRFPAQYPSVVAVAGTKVNARPWSGFFSTGKGRAIDTAAPAVDVWRAAAEGKERHAEFSIGRGKGTTFAAPQVAGAAALWLQHYTRKALQKRYGRAAVPAAFILHLRTNGARSPEEMTKLAEERHLPNAADIAKQAAKDWPKNMGPGILAADKLIALPLQDLPTRKEVCQYVYQERGAEALGAVCPPRECPLNCAAADCDNDKIDLERVLKGALTRPEYHIDPTVSLVVGLTLGAPFGTPFGFENGIGAVSFGFIRSRHQYRMPRGLLVQAKAGEKGFSIGAGFAELQEYGPLRDGEGKYATIPGFGGILGYSWKAAYLYTDSTSHLGLELGFSIYRGKLNAGVFWPLGSNRSQKARFTIDAGFGF